MNWIEKYFDFLGQSFQRILPERYLVNRWVELTVVSIFITLLFLVIVKFFGRPKKLYFMRRKIFATAYEILLFWKNPRAIMSSEVKLIGQNFKYMLFLLPSLLLGGILFAGIFKVMNNRYSYTPASEGEQIVVVAKELRVKPSDVVQAISEQNGLEINAYTRNKILKKVWIRLKSTRRGLVNITNIGKLKTDVIINTGDSSYCANPEQLTSWGSLSINYPLHKWLGKQKGWLIGLFGVCLVATKPLSKMINVEL